MGFSTALSGLNAAANNLSVTGNNIANANTTGFKKSRSEFADVYASSFGGVSKTQPGSGVRVTEVAQQFSQGNIEYTENTLDLAISGNGFFSLLTENREGLEPTIFTRSGAFQVDSQGYVVTDQGYYLAAINSKGAIGAVQIPTKPGRPKATEDIELQINLDAAAKQPGSFNNDGDFEPLAFDPTNPKTYNSTTTVTVYDSKGDPRVLTYYFVGPAPNAAPENANTWNAFVYFNGIGISRDDGTGEVTPVAEGEVPTPLTFQFNSSGNLIDISGNNQKLNFVFPEAVLINNPFQLAIDPLEFNVDFTGSTQYSTKFSVNKMNQDGYPPGILTGLEVNKEGIIYARYSNGSAEELGQLRLARFVNPQGLNKLGDTLWSESADSGRPIPGRATDNGFGFIQSAALEQSNVDLAAQLVNLIIAQQTYQANAKTISTEDQIVQSILNIR